MRHRSCWHEQRTKTPLHDPNDASLLAKHVLATRTSSNRCCELQGGPMPSLQPPAAPAPKALGYLEFHPLGVTPLNPSTTRPTPQFTCRACWPPLPLTAVLVLAQQHTQARKGRCVGCWHTLASNTHRLPPQPVLSHTFAIQCDCACICVHGLSWHRTCHNLLQPLQEPNPIPHHVMVYAKNDSVQGT